MLTVNLGMIALMGVIYLQVQPTITLDNGLALTPPMGWLTWERFRCNTDCKNDPENCISEHLIKVMANHMVANGYLEAGYEYITVDDCWPLKQRDPETMRIVPDPARFPSGMKNLTDYVHKLGLKFGIYGDFGKMTCGGYPGSEFFLQIDANTFAEWGIDLLKFDGCYSDSKDMDVGYPIMSKYLNMTGRPILYSCSWPAYEIGKQPNYTAISKSCNMWRNYGDVQDSWDSVKSIVEFYGKDTDNFSAYAGPGHWNDPDMLIVGDYGLSYEQQRAQMAMWAIMASPLIMSVDLRSIPDEAKQILQNPRVIAVNQDRLGVQGTRIQVTGNIQLWRKSILPTGSYAYVILNVGTGGTPARVSYKVGSLVANSLYKYKVTETFDGRSLGILGADDNVSAVVNPTGVFMFTMTPVSGSRNIVRGDSHLRFKVFN